MTIFWILFIVSILALIPSIIWAVKDEGYSDSPLPIMSSFLFTLISLSMLVCGIIQPISLKKEAIRQEKERQQIEYQIENLNEDSDKIKLNEWILTYNDWVNDVNTSKEIYGWFSWYRDFDMTEHTIIDLV